MDRWRKRGGASSPFPGGEFNFRSRPAIENFVVSSFGLETGPGRGPSDGNDGNVFILAQLFRYQGTSSENFGDNQESYDGLDADRLPGVRFILPLGSKQNNFLVRLRDGGMGSVSEQPARLEIRRREKGDQTGKSIEKLLEGYGRADLLIHLLSQSSLRAVVQIPFSLAEEPSAGSIVLRLNRNISEQSA